MPFLTVLQRQSGHFFGQRIKATQHEGVGLAAKGLHVPGTLVHGFQSCCSLCTDVTSCGDAGVAHLSPPQRLRCAAKACAGPR